MLHLTCSRILLLALALSIPLGTLGTAVDVLVARDVQVRHEQNQESVDTPTSSSHSHSAHHAEPLVELNETDILLSHSPDPLSYWAHDFERDVEDVGSNWRGLMGLHVFGMSLAFFVMLPVAISLRSLRHRWRSTTFIAFNVVALCSSAAGTLYKTLTGDLYEGSIHGRGGFLVLTLMGILTVCDALGFLRRTIAFLRGPDNRNIHLFWHSVVLNRAKDSSEYVRLGSEDSDGYHPATLHHHEDEEDTQVAQFVTGSADSTRGYSSEWINREKWSQSAPSTQTIQNSSHHRHHSITSEETLNLNPPISTNSEVHYNDDPQERSTWLSRTGRLAFATAQRSLLLLAFVQLLSGTTVYTGICRQNYINGCMAHMIKGGIFWCYGLLTFARYLGAWADLGWAWNRLPARRAHKVPSAETVESFVIFLYGATNVWMERFGAAPGSPFTTKQLQHISIAAMFWFAGMLGVALESRALRRWLGSPGRAVIKPDEQVPEPPSYRGSFNPFPALVIGVTGVAMSAHHQTYLFQVQIHSLWGFLLAGFAVFRCLTYLFLWLRPPHSVLPSRPPTEVLASFFLASGGLVFILSTEQITFAAMRRQMDDMMFFLNLAVTTTCLVFCWVMAITAFKGWVAFRMPTVSLSSPTHKVLSDEHVA